MAYKPSKARYSGGGKALYLVYTSPQRLANGKQQTRTRVKRMYFPKDATDITLGRPGMLERRTGRKVYGVEVRYRYVQDRARGRVDSKRSKIVELSEDAKALKLTDDPPEGPRQAVA
jgi:hypothetical protein